MTLRRINDWFNQLIDQVLQSCACVVPGSSEVCQVWISTAHGPPPPLSPGQGRVFQKKTQTLKQKKRWENQRMKVVIIIVVVLVAAVAIGGIIYAIVGA